MASRSYAQIGCTLPSSKKLRKLQSHKARWAYICAHLSPLGNYTGMFRYPLAVWADDASLSVSELESYIDELETVGLIEFDPDEQVVRIVAWFHKKNCPENASRMISLVGDYYMSDGVNLDMYCRSVSEFVVGSIRRAQGWKQDSPDWPKLRECFQPFLRQIYQDTGNTFMHALASEVLASGKAVRAEICSLFPLFGDELASLESPPCPHPVDTLPPYDTRRDDTYTTQKKDGDEKKTAQFSNSSHRSDEAPSEQPVELHRIGGDGLTRSSMIKRSKLAMESRSAAGG
ncbi:hypothetical protein [uncultured Litoreibacter sp.]|uniref:hypothetical protein n=1 Tax=uncultured Litoreibacter sp. TaxID=1392394 RepID=UPI0026335ECC|nr:hypothetical protein [uncultured Litoreibacter sp.]